MTDSMTLEEYHEYNRTGRLPRRFKQQTRSETLHQVATASPDLLDTAVNARKPDQMPKAKIELEEYLEFGGFGAVVREYQFHPKRRWRADYYLPNQDPPVLIEYDGLMHQGANASHASIGGILRDSEKINAATALGFRVFRANAKSIDDGSFFELMESVLKQVQQDGAS